MEVHKANSCNCVLPSLGMLLRFFVHFYDMEIIEEEAFLAWKEDITQEFPGKGKALFQVNLITALSLVIPAVLEHNLEKHKELSTREEQGEIQ